MHSVLLSFLVAPAAATGAFALRRTLCDRSIGGFMICTAIQRNHPGARTTRPWARMAETPAALFGQRKRERLRHLHRLVGADVWLPVCKERLLQRPSQPIVLRRFRQPPRHVGLAAQ